MVSMVVTSLVPNSPVPWQSDGGGEDCTLMSWRTARSVSSVQLSRELDVSTGHH